MNCVHFIRPHYQTAKNDSASSSDDIFSYIGNTRGTYLNEIPPPLNFSKVRCAFISTMDKSIETRFQCLRSALSSAVTASGKVFRHHFGVRLLERSSFGLPLYAKLSFQASVHSQDSTIITLALYQSVNVLTVCSAFEYPR